MPAGMVAEKEHDAALIAALLHDRLDILDEAHVEHLVGLVEDEEFDMGEVEGAAAQVVEDAAGGADHDVDASAQAPELLAHRGSAVDGRHARVGARAQRDELGRHLQGELARGHEDDGADMADRGREELGEGNAEGGGLARAGSGAGDEVGSGGEEARDSEGLYGGRLLEALPGEGGERIGTEPEGLEGWFVHVYLYCNAICRRASTDTSDF
jgi:hypothetical protein